jgi:hypothetical protein
MQDYKRVNNDFDTPRYGKTYVEVRAALRSGTVFFPTKYGIVYVPVRAQDARSGAWPPADAVRKYNVRNKISGWHRSVKNVFFRIAGLTMKYVARQA